MSRFIVLLLIGFVDNIGIGLVFPLFSVLLFDHNHHILSPDASLELRGAVMGSLIAATSIVQFFISPYLGAYADRKGRKKALVVGISAACIGYLTAMVGIVTNSLILLFAYRILVGISEGTVAVSQAALADLCDEKNKARRFSMHSAALGFGFAIGPFLGGFLGDSSNGAWFGYNTPFLFAGLMSLTNLLLVIFTFKETRQIIDAAPFNFFEGITTVTKVFALKDLQIFFIGAFALAFGWISYGEFAPILLIHRFDFTLSNIGNYYAIGGAWYGVASMFAAGTFLQRFNPEKLASYSLLSTGICMLMLILVRDSYYVWWILPMIMFSIAIAYPTATAIVSNRTSIDTQGEVLGIYQSVQAIAMGAAPLMLGSLVGAFPPATALVGACAMFIASVAFWMGSRKPQPVFAD